MSKLSNNFISVLFTFCFFMFLACIAYKQKEVDNKMEDECTSQGGELLIKGGHTITYYCFKDGNMLFIK